MPNLRISLLHSCFQTRLPNKQRSLTHELTRNNFTNEAHSYNNQIEGTIPIVYF